MGVVELVLTCLAFTAPSVVVLGQIPVVIQFGHLGAPLVFGAAMILLLLFAVGYVAMTRYLPNPGAFYAYVTAGLGKIPGLGASFAAIFGYACTAIGAQVWFGFAVSKLIHDTFSGPDIPWYIISLIGVALAGMFGYFRIDVSAKVLTVVMTLEVLMVAVYDFGVVGNGGPNGRTLQPFTWDAFTSGSLGIGVLFAAISFLGFEATAVFREEVKDPTRTVSRAAYAAVLFIGFFYLLTTWTTIIAYGDSALDVANNAPATMVENAASKYLGTWAEDTFSVLVCTSIIAVLISVQNICSRYLFSLGTDRVLPAPLGRVHSRHGSPYVASLVLSVIVIVGVLLSMSAAEPYAMYITLVGSGGFAVIFLIFLTAISVIVYFSSMKSTLTEGRPAKWRTHIAPGLAAAGTGIVLYISIAKFNLLTGSIFSAIIMQVLIWLFFVAGIVLALVYKRKRPEVYLRIGRQKVE